jgi:hypothetical protein
MAKDVLPPIARIRARSAAVAAAKERTQVKVERAQALAALVPAATELTRQQAAIEERILAAAAEAIKSGAAVGVDSAEASFSLFGEGFSSEVLIAAWMATAGRLRAAGYEVGDLFERARQLYVFTVSWAVVARVDDGED